MREKETQHDEQQRESGVDVPLHLLFKKFLHNEITQYNNSNYEDENTRRRQPRGKL